MSLDALFAMLSSTTGAEQSLFDSDIDAEKSSVYNTSGAKREVDADAPVAIIYGKSKVSPVLLNYYVESGEYDTLNMLYGIGEGEISGVESITVGGKDIQDLFSETVQNSYNNNAEITISKGTIGQAPVNGFDDTHNVYQINESNGFELLYNIPYIYEMANENTENFTITFQMDKCYYQNEDGILGSWYQSVQIDYRHETNPSWTFAGIFQFTGQSESLLKRTFKSDNLSAGKYYIRITKVSSDQDNINYFGSLLLKEIDEISLEQSSHPGTALAKIRIVTTASFQSIFMIVRGKVIRAPNVVDGNGEAVLWEDYYWDADLNLFRKFSTGQHLIWNNDWRQEWCGNTALCLRDLILNKRYGLGVSIDESFIVEDSFVEGMLFCETGVAGTNGQLEKRCRLDITIDALNPAYTWLNLISKTMRAWIDYSYNMIRLVVEQKEEPVFLFNETNIIPKTFQLDYISEKKIPNVFNLKFYNQDNDYKSDSYALPDEEAINAGEFLKESSQQYIGITRLSQILREGEFLLKKYRVNKTPIKFKTYIHAFPCKQGDVFYFQNNDMGWGAGGRLQNGCENNKLILDKAVEIPLGSEYEVILKNIEDDKIEKRSIIETGGSFTEITPSIPFSFIPQKYCEWYIYEKGTEVKYRVSTITRSLTGIVEISAINYGESIYENAAITAPLTNYKYTTLEIPLVTNFIAKENVVRLADGTINELVNLSWAKPVNSSRYIKTAKSFDVCMSDNAGISWTFIGNTDKNEFTVSNIFSVNQTYKFAICTVTEDNEKTVPANSPQYFVTIAGWTKRPLGISTLNYQFDDEITFSWNKSIESNIGGYEIRTNDENWGVIDSNFIWRGYAEQYTIIRPTARTGVIYYIRPFNTTGLYSELSTSVMPQNLAPEAPSLVANTLFQKVFLMWNDSSDLDIEGYEIWNSSMPEMTGTASATENLLSKTIGTSITVTVDYNPTYFRIRGYDKFGAGDWSNIVKADKITLTETDISDSAISENKIVAGSITAGKIAVGAIHADHLLANIVTADKMNINCLSAISANLGCMTAGTLVGAIIKTSDDLYRTEINRDGLRSYDVNGVKLVDLSQGQLRLYDPSCESCYSFLDAGALAFKTPYDTIPYVKRICSGIACAGETVTLCRWINPPELNLGIKRLMSYSPDKAESCQEWCIYADGIRKYDCGGEDFGYKFDVHARLSVSGGTRPEEIYLDNFGVSHYTGANTCQILIKELFQFWSHAPAPANICYGILDYDILYRVCGCGVWCCQTKQYQQPATSETLMKITNISCQTLNLPCGAVWEVCLRCNSLMWQDSGIISGGTTCCLCCYQYNVDCSKYCQCLLTINGTLCGTASISSCCNMIQAPVKNDPMGDGTWQVTCNGIWTLLYSCMCGNMNNYIVQCCITASCNFSWGSWDTASKPISSICDIVVLNNSALCFCTPSSWTVDTGWPGGRSGVSGVCYEGPTAIKPFMDRVKMTSQRGCRHLSGAYCCEEINTIHCAKTIAQISGYIKSVGATGCCCCFCDSYNDVVSCNKSNFGNTSICLKKSYSGNTGWETGDAACGCIAISAYSCGCMRPPARTAPITQCSVSGWCITEYNYLDRANICIYSVVGFSTNFTACRLICYKNCVICSATCCYWYPVPCGSAGSCEYAKFYSMRDTTANECVLDPYGEINYLAIAYS